MSCSIYGIERLRTTTSAVQGLQSNCIRYYPAISGTIVILPGAPSETSHTPRHAIHATYARTGHRTKKLRGIASAYAVTHPVDRALTLRIQQSFQNAEDIYIKIDR